MRTNLKRRLLIGFSIIVASIIIAILVLHMFAESISTTADKIASDRSAIDQQSGSLAVLASLRAQSSQAATYQAAMDAMLPTQDGLIRFSPWVTDAASADGVSAQVSFTGNALGGAGVNGAGSMPFSFSAGGSLDAISKFLADIASNQPGFLVQIISFDAIYQNGSYHVTGQGNVYFKAL